MFFREFNSILEALMYVKGCIFISFEIGIRIHYSLLGSIHSNVPFQFDDIFPGETFFVVNT